MAEPFAFTKDKTAVGRETLTEGDMEAEVVTTILSINVVQSPPLGLVAANINTCEVAVGTNVALAEVQLDTVTEATEKIEVESIRTSKSLTPPQFVLLLYDQLTVYVEPTDSPLSCCCMEENPCKKA
jgi:hypothetical protein